MSMRTIYTIAALALSLADPIMAQAADIVVVAAAASPAGAINASQAGDVFLGRNTNLPGIDKAVVVDQSEGAAARDEFYTKIVGKSPAQMRAYWGKQIFTGMIQPPKAVGDNAAVKAALAKNPNTIGYLEKSAVDSSVKVLLELK